MAMRTRAAVVRHPGGDFEYEEVELESPRPDEVLVRMIACGVCHTDIAARDGLFGLRFPAVLGHEGAGVVEAVGNKVSRVRAGDRVVLSFGSCGHCAGCKKGHPARCLEFDEINFGGSRVDGSQNIRDSKGRPVTGSFFGQSSFSYHALAGERNLVPVDAADEDQLAVFAPLGCGVQAGAGTVLNELKPVPGESAAIFGAGAVGLAALMAARIAGAGPIVAVDIIPSRLELALQLGASVVIDGRKEDVGAKLRQTIGAVDHAVETTGVPRVVDHAIRSLGPRGKISLLGIPVNDPEDPVSPMRTGPGQTAVHSIAGDSNPLEFIPFLIRSYLEGRFPVDRLIREYPASKINEAVEDSLKGITIKPVLRF